MNFKLQLLFFINLISTTKRLEIGKSEEEENKNYYQKIARSFSDNYGIRTFHIAIKISDAEDKNQSVIGSLKETLDMLATLQHVNIISVVKLSRKCDGYHNYHKEMPTCSLHSYFKKLYEEKDFTISIFVRIFKAILTTIQYLYEKCIVHNNLNLYNIYFSFSTNSIKISGFESAIDFRNTVNYQIYGDLNSLHGTDMRYTAYLIEDIITEFGEPLSDPNTTARLPNFNLLLNDLLETMKKSGLSYILDNEGLFIFTVSDALNHEFFKQPFDE